MSDGEPYDADGDVSRFLHCPSPEPHLFPLSEPVPHTLNAAPDLGHLAPPIDAGHHDAPAAPTIYAGHYEAPAIDAVHYEASPPINSVNHEAPPPIVNAEHYEAPPSVDAMHYDEAPPVNAQEDHQLAAMDDGEQYQAMAMDVIQPAHMTALAPETQQAYGFPAPMQGVDGVDAVHHQAPTVDADLFQVPAMDDVEQAMLMDLMLAPEMQQGYGGFPADPTLVQGHGVNATVIAAEHYQEPIVNGAGVDGEHQLPALDVDDHQQMAMDVLQPTQMLAPDEMMQQGSYECALPDPTLLQGEQHYGAPVIAADHHQAPVINAAEEHHQMPAMDVDPQHQTMPMDVHVQPTQMLVAPEMPDAAPMQGGAGGEGNVLANDNGGVIPPPSVSVYEQLINDGEPELAAILQMIEGGRGGASAGGGGGGEAADDQRHLLCPAEEDVVFKRIFPGQLDCSRCYSVRDILRQNGPLKKHFMVHSSYKGTFQHAVVNHMAIGADGQFHTTVLLYHDLRGRRDEWVQSFISKSVEKLNRTGQLLLDTCPSEGAPECSNNNNIIAPPPQPSNQDQHGELEVDTVSNLLPAAASTADHQAASAEAAEPSQPQENTNTGAPSVPEAAVPVEVSPEDTQPAITQPQENTADAAPVAETAAAPEAAASPKAAEPSSVTQAQENADAPPSEAAAAAVVPEAGEPLAASRNEQQQITDAWENFDPFNWDGFQPDHILESSQLQPYDPESGVDVLMYPSMQEQLRLEKLKKKESKRLSKMAIEDTPDYLNLNEDHYANEPNFASQSFKNLCENDATFRMYKRRVSGLVRKIKKLEQNATRVGKGGLFTIKQKLEAYKSEKEELYDMIKRGLQEHERRNNGAGPSNVAAAAGTSNNNDAGPSNVAAAADTSNNDAGTSIVAADTSDDNDDADPSNVAAAGTSNNNDAGPSDHVAADTSNTNDDPSNVVGSSGTN